jgi:hypothetical protein
MRKGDPILCPNCGSSNIEPGNADKGTHARCRVCDPTWPVASKVEKPNDLIIKAAALQAAITDQHPQIETAVGAWLATGGAAAAEFAGLIAQYRIIVHKRRHGELEEPCALFDEALKGAGLEYEAAERAFSEHGAAGDAAILGCSACFVLAVSGAKEETCPAGQPLKAAAKRMRLRRSALYFCDHWEVLNHGN